MMKRGSLLSMSSDESFREEERKAERAAAGKFPATFSAYIHCTD